MKKYLYLLNKKCLWITSILLLMFFSCSEDKLTEKPLDFLAPDNAYLTESGILQGITAMHDRVRQAYYAIAEFGTMIPNQVHGTDLAYEGEEPRPGDGYLNSYPNDLTPVCNQVKSYWKTGFQIVGWANLLIEKTQLLDPSVFKDGEAGKNMYIGEARFFRAFAYRNLVSAYGDIPLLTEPVKTAKDDFVRDPAASILKLMEDDFKFAAENLPEPGQEAAPGRITQGAAYHYLSETYLEEKEYQSAADAASKVIDGYNYALMTHRFGNRLAVDIFGGGDPFYDLFGYSNHNLAENTEAIWVIQVEPFIQGGSSADYAYICGPRYFDLGTTPDGYKAIRGIMFNGIYTGYDDTISRPCANVRGTNFIMYDIWNSDWNNDTRNAKWNIKRSFYYDNPESAYDKQKIDFSLYPPGTRDPIADTCKILFPLHTKFSDPKHYFLEPNRAGGGIVHKDWYAVRLAETLLLRAEANVGLGNLDLAAADINKVRTRSNATPVLAADVDIDYILDERARELYLEEWRVITLRRTGKLLERTRKYNDNPICPGANIQDFNVLWPIPQEQIDLNIGASFPQNPGYPGAN
jgi:hypothetical protein